ncbi:MAG: hypothetical protein HY694_12995 [Deltaproteobacteria bacterium]|nr:hypothetical protein [Deltaproteobacteria bacterium]
MPDIWTKHPDVVRDLLGEGGFRCGVEPRILKGRDPKWTCIVDGKRMWGDLYIHHADEILKMPAQIETPRGLGMLGGWEFVVLGVLLAIILGQTWAISKLKRKALPS